MFTFIKKILGLKPLNETTTKEQDNQEDDNSLEKFTERINNHASKMRYIVDNDNLLYILAYDSKDNPQLVVSHLSKDRKKFIIFGSGAVHLSNFYVQVERKGFAFSILINANNLQVKVYSYDFTHDEYFNNAIRGLPPKSIEKVFSQVIEAFVKIFFDVSDTFDCPEVRADKKDIELIKELIEKENKP